jgi:GNAT superfamily N-acetyltransferase
MISVNEVQSYLRHSARQRYEALALPPFTAFFHPTDPFPHFSYAIPDGAIEGEVQPVLQQLVAAFEQRQRQPRFEFIEAFAPTLAAELEQAGFVLEGRQPLMVCTPATFAPPPRVAGLTITQIAGESPLPDALDFLNTQRQGFNPDDPAAASAEEAQRLLQATDDLISFLGRLDGQPAGVATYTLPHAGVTEIAGVATMPPLRRRGIAGALTAAAVQAAFAHGAELACLSAGDAAAGRVYQQVGFQPYATMLAYHLPADL